MKILFVDDNHSLQEAFREYAEPRGHEVRFASTSEEAQRILLLGFRPNVLLVDIMLRGRQSGVEFIRRLAAANRDRKTLPVVILTSGSDVIPDLATTIPVLQKPQDPDRILDILEQAQEASGVLPAQGEQV